VTKFDFPAGCTPLEDLSGLKFPWIQTLSDLNRAEAENIFRAQKKYLEKGIDHPSKWFNPTFFRKVHHSMFGVVWSWAGTWRKSVTNIGIQPHFIPMRLAEFCAQVIAWDAEPAILIEQSAHIHHRLVSIHPFENGNGRFSRLVADRYLLAHKCAHPVWPSELGQEGIVRKRYIQSLKAADKGDFCSLIDLMKEFLPRPVLI
jgi:Fic-DOC domain mobile mystery protein B